MNVCGAGVRPAIKAARSQAHEIAIEGKEYVLLFMPFLAAFLNALAGLKPFILIKNSGSGECKTQKSQNLKPL